MVTYIFLLLRCNIQDIVQPKFLLVESAHDANSHAFELQMDFSAKATMSPVSGTPYTDRSYSINDGYIYPTPTYLFFMSFLYLILLYCRSGYQLCM